MTSSDGEDDERAALLVRADKPDKHPSLQISNNAILDEAGCVIRFLSFCTNYTYFEILYFWETE